MVFHFILILLVKIIEAYLQKDCTSIQFDNNDLPCLIERRNHPCYIQHPYAFPWYGAKNDTKQLLINATETKTLQEPGRD